MKDDGLKINQYQHGGSRIYFQEEDGGSRNLVVDTYQTHSFSAYIYECVKYYFDELAPK